MQNLKKQTNDTTDLTILNQNLKQFGLCPADWKLQMESHQRIMITHKDDPEFYFVGKINDESKSWEFIQLGFN